VLESTLRTISGSATQPGKMHPDLQQKAILGRQLPNKRTAFDYISYFAKNEESIQGICI
jgi:hypothetical protein